MEHASDSEGSDPPPPPTPSHVDSGRTGKALALLGSSPPPTPNGEYAAHVVDERRAMSFGHGEHRAAIARGMKKVRRSLIASDIAGGDFGHGVHRKKVVNAVKKALGAQERAASNPLSMLMLSTYIRRLQRWIRRWLRHRKLGLLRNTQHARMQRSISDLSKGHDLTQRRISVSIDQRAALMHQKLMAKRAKLLRKKHELELSESEASTDDEDPPPPATEGTEFGASPSEPDGPRGDDSPLAVHTTIIELSESEASTDDEDPPPPTTEGAEFGASQSQPDGRRGDNSPTVVHVEIARLLSGLENAREARETLARASMSHLAQRRAKLSAKRAHLERVAKHFDELAPEGTGVVSRDDLKLLPALSRVGFAESEQLSADLFSVKEGGREAQQRRNTLDRGTVVELIASLDSEIAAHDGDAEATHGAVAAGNVAAAAAARIAVLEAELARANRRAESVARDAAAVATTHAEAAYASRIAALEAELEGARAQGARAARERDHATGELSRVMSDLASSKAALATAKVSGVLSVSAVGQCARAARGLRVRASWRGLTQRPSLTRSLAPLRPSLMDPFPTKAAARVRKTQSAAAAAAATTTPGRKANAKLAARHGKAATAIQAAARKKLVKKKKKKTATTKHGASTPRGSGALKKKKRAVAARHSASKKTPVERAGHSAAKKKKRTGHHAVKKKKKVVRKKHAVVKKKRRAADESSGGDSATALEASPATDSESEAETSEDDDAEALLAAERTQYAKWAKSTKGAASPKTKKLVTVTTKHRQAIVALGILKESHRALRSKHAKLERLTSSWDERVAKHDSVKRAHVVHVSEHAAAEAQWQAMRASLENELAALRDELDAARALKEPTAAAKLEVSRRGS